MFLKTLIILWSLGAFAVSDECSYFKYCGSSTGSTSAQKSSPSASSSSRSNPTVLAKLKGLGLESLYQKSNPIEFSLVSGNGRIGTLASSTSGENSFFGNRTPELEDEFLNRTINDRRYKNTKFQFGSGFSLIDTKKFEFNLGGSALYNPDTKNYNFGYSVSLRILMINLSAYTYRDDFRFDYTNHYCYTCSANYATFYGQNNYQEKFNVTSFTLGTKIGNFSFDYTNFKTKYNFYNTTANIKILSTAYHLNSFLFNFAYRNETSGNPIVLNNQIFSSLQKQFTFYGVQYLPNKHLSLGIGYNNYLMNELSFTLTMFL